MRKSQVAMALLASLSIIAASCGDDEKEDANTVAPTTVAEAPDETTGDTAAPDTTPTEVDYMWTPNADVLAGAEGQVNIVAWPYYIESGGTVETADWVTPFTEITGCAVNVKLGNSSDEMVQLMQSGEYDGVSASGDATQRLISGGDVAAIDVAEFSSYDQIFDQLKDQLWNSVDGVPYGMPHGRGANLLVYNTEAFADGAPDSWSVIFEPGSAAEGAASVYDFPIYIADAALYLMTHSPELGITNPYALDQTQFDAAMALLEAQSAVVGQYWQLYTDQQAALEDGSVLAGTTWQVVANIAQGNGALIDVTKPVEGATGWSDTWMLASSAANPNCMKLWMDWIASPWANSQATAFFGEASSNELGCALEGMAEVCETFHAEDADYWTDVWYWTTPTEQCLDGRTDVACVPFTEWVNAWTALRA